MLSINLLVGKIKNGIIKTKQKIEFDFNINRIFEKDGCFPKSKKDKLKS